VGPKQLAPCDEVHIGPVVIKVGVLGCCAAPVICRKGHVFHVSKFFKLSACLLL